MDETLSSSEQLWSAVAQQSLNGILLLEPLRDDAGTIVDFVYQEANQAAAKILDVPRDVLIGGQLGVIFPQAGPAGVIKQYAKIVDSGVAECFEVPYDDGRLCGVFMVQAFMVGESLALTFMDISEQLQLREQLKARNERLEVALSSGSMGFWDWDIPSDYFEYSLLIDNQSGLTQDDVGASSQQWRELVHPDDLATVVERIEAHLLDESTPYEVRYRMRRGADAYVWVRSRGRVIERDANGSPKRMIGTHEDVTERVEKEQQLWESEAILKTAIMGSGVGIWDWNLENNQAAFSGYWGQIIGVDHASLTPDANEWYSRVHPDDLEVAQQSLDAHIADPSIPFECVHRLRHANGSWRWVRGSGHVIEWNAEGKPSRMVGTNLDVTDDIETRRELVEARIAAEAASYAKSAFLAHMSHELRTPMTAVLGFAELLNGDEGSTRERKTWANAIQSNGSHLLAILNDVLDISKVEAGKLELATGPLDLNEMLAGMHDLMKTRARSKGVSLRVRLASSLPTKITSDATRVRQILSNLLSNAIKFTDEGAITLEVSHDKPADRLVFRVIDSGQGIGESLRSKLFAPFIQGVGPGLGGTGLGLTISRQLAQLLGGDLVLERSEIGVGSVFRCEIAVVDPFDTGSLTKISPRNPQNVSTTGDKIEARVLLVDDGKDNRRLIRHFLEKAGVEVLEAENGAEAIERWQWTAASQKPVDLILMDIQMPVLDGIGATRQLRQLGCNAPIAALTAHAMIEQRNECIQAGCDAFLTKPIQRADLLNAVRDLIGPKRNAA